MVAHKRTIRVLCFALILLLPATAYAEDGYRLGAVSMAAGASGSVAASGYRLTMALGQPDAAEGTSGGYTFVGGVLPESSQGEAPGQYRVFLPWLRQ
jgi:hypothetical protein